MSQRVPFPPPSTSKRGLLPSSTSVDPLPVGKRARTSEKPYKATLEDGIAKIGLPSSHKLSLLLCAQRQDAQKVFNSDTFTLTEPSPGLLQVKVVVGAPDLYETPCIADGNSVNSFNPYQYTSVSQHKSGYIPVYIGGAGTSVDYDYCSIQGRNGVDDQFLEQRTPVLIRVAVPISHIYCDEGGIVKNAFWSIFDCCKTDENLIDDSNKNEGWGVNLVNICHRILHMFQRPLSNDVGIDIWNKICTFNNKKQGVIKSYMRHNRFKNLFWDHCKLRRLPLDWLAPKLRDLLKDSSPMKTNDRSKWNSILQKECDNVYSFELFTSEFCQMLTKEVDTYEATALPRRRPNTMNKAGLIVNEIGLEGLMTSLLQDVISPISQICFPEELFVSSLDHHHSFVVEYSAGKDKFLDMHHDSSEVTLNICLGKNFEGSELRFCGQFGSSDHRSFKHIYEHVTGRGVIHLGRQRHGADSITSGHRMNLIMWARSSYFRNAAACGFIYPDGYPKEHENTNYVNKACLSSANDDDYEILLSKS